MAHKPIRIVTNLPGLAEAAPNDTSLDVVTADVDGAFRFLAKCVSFAVATRGREYANRAQGEARLFRDILRASLTEVSVSEDARRVVIQSRA
jgi:leucyl-tRNA synthetase